MSAIEINVRGSHTVTLPPERATVHASLAMEGPDPEPVFRAVEATLADITRSIASLHHPKRGPVTWYSVEQVRMSAHRPWNSDGIQLPLVHSASVTITAKFSDFDELAKWVSANAGADGLGISHIDWALTEAKRTDVERRTRQKAVRDAKRRAQDYADALDLGSVRVRSISDPGTSRPVAAKRMAMMADGAGGGTPALTLRPEDVEIGAEVEATFVVGRK